MQLHLSDDVDAYAAAAAGFLEAEPCSRSVLRSVMEAAREGLTEWIAPPSFWWASEADRVVAAASWTPPYPLLVSTLAADVAGALAASVGRRADQLQQRVPGVVGPRAAAEAVAHAWTDGGGGPTHEHLCELLHRLDSLREPWRPAGNWRPAAADDTDLCAGWLSAFVEDVGLLATTASPRGWASRVIEAGRCFLWEAGGTEVCLVAHSPALAGVVRIGPVYTPGAHRRRGYARRLTYEVTRKTTAAPGVSEAVLFTDAANPVSNSIYRQIGYRPIEEHVEIKFGI